MGLLDVVEKAGDLPLDVRMRAADPLARALAAELQGTERAALLDEVRRAGGDITASLVHEELRYVLGAYVRFGLGVGNPLERLRRYESASAHTEKIAGALRVIADRVERTVAPTAPRTKAAPRAAKKTTAARRS